MHLRRLVPDLTDQPVQCRHIQRRQSCANQQNVRPEYCADRLPSGAVWSGGAHHESARTGLSDILAGRSDDGHLLPVAPFDNLALLCAGPQPPNPHELLGKPSFGALNHELAHRYDIVVYDVPPLSSGADAYAVAQRARGVLLVVGRSTTRKSELRELRSRMLRSGVEIVGAVLADS